MKNNHKFQFASKVTDRILLRINFLIDTIQPAFQCQINIVLRLWMAVEITLIQRWKWNKIWSWIFNVAQRWYNVSVQHRNNIKSTLQYIDAMLHKVISMLFQCWHDIISTLFQHGLNVSSSHIESNLASEKCGFAERLISFIKKSLLRNFY